jgi:hypothetical protein
MQTLLVIWSSMCSSIVMFFVIAVLVAPQGAGEVDATVPLVLVLVGFAESMFALVGAPLVLKGKPAQTAWIIRFALMEAAALFGFVAYWLGATLPGAALMGWALFGQFLQVPTAARVEAWEAGGDGR